MIGINIFFFEYVEEFKHLLSEKIISKSSFIKLVEKDKKHKKSNIKLFLSSIKNSDFIEIYLKNNLVYWNYKKESI